MRRLFGSWANWVIILVGAPAMVVLPRLISGTPMSGSAWFLLAISPLVAIAVFALAGLLSLPIRRMDGQASVADKHEGGEQK